MPASSQAVGRATRRRPGRTARVRRAVRSTRRARARSRARHGAADPSLLVPPPVEDGVENAPAVVLEHGRLRFSTVSSCRVERGLVRADAAVQLVADPRLDMVCRIGRVPLKVADPLARVAVLQVRRLPVSAQASAEQVAIAELLVRVAALTAPVFDLHRVAARCGSAPCSSSRSHVARSRAHAEARPCRRSCRSRSAASGDAPSGSPARRPWRSPSFLPLHEVEQGPDPCHLGIGLSELPDELRQQLPSLRSNCCWPIACEIFARSSLHLLCPWVRVHDLFQHAARIDAEGVGRRVDLTVRDDLNPVVRRPRR